MGTTLVTAEPGSPQLFITRDFDAPADLVFRAHAEPELLAQWLGPRQYVADFSEFNFRHGGTWRFVHRSPETGAEYAFRGVFHGEPSIENGICQTWEFEGAPGHVSLQTMTLEERDGRTYVTANAIWQTVEARDANIANGMEYGVREGYERLDEILARLGSPVGAGSAGR
jgi:uncharacterized protein YndB with AHSA1/START domain